MRGKPAESDWERRKRRAEVFGDPMPDTTRDERGDAPERDDESDRWLREQVPPHHGS
ncbi:hypothetical protein GCM10027062_22730 [Nocardioides hungaricus]